MTIWGHNKNQSRNISKVLGSHGYSSTNWEYCSSLDTQITMIKITEYFSKLKNGKAGGPDGITNECIKKSFSVTEN